jgi:hypothetical protein
MPSRRIADEIRTNQKNRGLPDQNGSAALSSSVSKRPGWDKVIGRSLSGKYNVLSVTVGGELLKSGGHRRFEMNVIRGGRVTSYMDDIQPQRSSEGGSSLDRVNLVNALIGAELGDHHAQPLAFH